MKQSLLTFVLLLPLTLNEINAQAIFETEIPFQEGECWWGGAVGRGALMPYAGPTGEFDLATDNAGNQIVPLLISNRGRFIWSEKPFKFEIKERSLVIRSYFGIVEPVLAGRTLREAYMGACAKHFAPSGKLPDELMFSAPQYNTWIELGYDPTQQGVTDYAKAIIAAGLPPGVLIIDDGWQRCYGCFEFKPDRFPDPKGMVAELHGMGFRVMVWVTPFVSPDSPVYRDLQRRGYLVKRKGTGNPAIIEWWNGHSASYDMTIPDAKTYFTSQLRRMQTDYGIDGFKFDGGDNKFYNTAQIENRAKDAVSTDHTHAWAQIGLEFPLHEYRACWMMGGQPVAQRLANREHSWEGVATLVPDALAAGLLGHAYVCPDMVGGGNLESFAGGQVDEKIIVRSAQIHALMPMMQFSVAPWRVLSAENMALVKQAVELRAKMAPYILECAKNAAQTGEPIVRHLEYVFPGEGFADCNDQYMLGERYMVAPVTTANDYRDVRLPKGRWRDDTGQTFRGGTSISIKVPPGRVPYFEKL